MRKLTYFAVLEPFEDGYKVFIPDVPGCECFGKDITEAQENVKGYLETQIYSIEKYGEKYNKEIPPATEFNLDKYAGSIVSPITILPDLVRNELDNKRVKTNTTIPRWLKDIGEENNVNFSQLLEASLIEYLGLENRKNNF